MATAAVIPIPVRAEDLEELEAPAPTPTYAEAPAVEAGFRALGRAAAKAHLFRTEPEAVRPDPAIRIPGTGQVLAATFMLLGLPSSEEAARFLARYVVDAARVRRWLTNVELPDFFVLSRLAVQLKQDAERGVIGLPDLTPEERRDRARTGRVVQSIALVLLTSTPDCAQMFDDAPAFERHCRLDICRWLAAPRPKGRIWHRDIRPSTHGTPSNSSSSSNSSRTSTGAAR